MTPRNERREHVRYLCYGVATIRIKTGSHIGASHVALVCDIGVKGMRLSMDRPIAIGTHVAISVSGQVEFIGTVRHLRVESHECIMGILLTAGKWNEQSDWPQYTRLPGEEQLVYKECDESKESVAGTAGVRQGAP